MCCVYSYYSLLNGGEYEHLTIYLRQSKYCLVGGVLLVTKNFTVVQKKGASCVPLTYEKVISLSPERAHKYEMS